MSRRHKEKGQDWKHVCVGKGKFLYSISDSKTALALLNSLFFFLPLSYFSSEDAMEHSKEFVTSVVLGKDLVPRFAFAANGV